MKHQHTPGPWRVLNKDGFLYVVGGDNILVADCYPDTAMDLGVPSRKEYNANAKLISATPELLKALDKIAVWLIAPDLSREVIKEMRELANVALANAGGGK